MGRRPEAEKEHSARDRAEGILLGLAAGDRNGGPIRMAVRLAESLGELGRADVNDIAVRYLDWWRHGAFDTGPTAARILTLVDSGLSFQVAARQVHIETGGQTAGCNPAHRSAPLAMMPGMDNQQLADYAVLEAKLTHHHPLAGDVAAAVVALCHELVQGAAWEDAVDAASAGRHRETQEALTNRDPGRLKRGGFGPDVLAAAVHFVGSSGSFDTALEASLRFAGPANYCPVLVGSLGGARWGADSIPFGMLDHCDVLPRVMAAAGGLGSRWVEAGEREGDPDSSEEELTSGGEPWSEIPESYLPHIEWIDCRYGPFVEQLPGQDRIPVPEALLRLPRLHEKRPTGSKAMLDAGAARSRLMACRPGAWIRSPYSGWVWAKFPDGGVGWVPGSEELPQELEVSPGRRHPREDPPP